MGDVTVSEVARRVDVSPGTLRRWVRDGIVPLPAGDWTPAAIAHARMVARLRDRGHTLDEIRDASESGRLASSYMEQLFPPEPGARTLGEAAEETGLEPALIERIWISLGLSPTRLESISDDDVELLRYAAAVLAAGFPLVAFLQLIRVYGHALASIADAEVKLFHLYVHEPLIRDGVARPGDGRGDGGPGDRAAAAGLADHGPPAPALPPALRRAGRGRPPGGRDASSTSAACT